MTATTSADAHDRRGLGRLRDVADERGIDLSPLVPLTVLVAVVLLIGAIEPAFLSSTSMQSSLLTAAPILLLAIGSALVVLTGGLDLSIGGMAALSSVCFAKAFPALGPVLGFVVVLAGAAAIGALQGWIHVKAQVPSFILTLGGLGVFAGAALKISGGSPVIATDNTDLLDWLAGMTLGLPNTFLVVLMVLVLLGALMRWTRVGRVVFAVGAAEPAARISGIRSTPVRVFVFAISAATAALAACCLMAQSGAGGSTLGDGLLLPTIAAVVVGGTAISGGIGGLGRAVLGGLIISAVGSGTAITGVSPGLQQILFGAATIIAVTLTTDRRRIGIVK